MENLGTIHRLAGINANGTNTGFYVNASDKVAFQSGATTLVSDFTIEANKEYHAVVTADTSNQVKIYAGLVGTSIRLAGTQTFPAPPFKLSVATPPDSIKIGYADAPSPGYLNGGVLKDFRLYGRALNEDEVALLFASALTATPHGTPETSQVSPVAAYNLRGAATLSSGSLPPATSVSTTHTLRGLYDSGESTASGNSVPLVVYNGSFNYLGKSPIVVGVTNTIKKSHTAYGGRQDVVMRAVYVYEDGTEIATAEQRLGNLFDNNTSNSISQTTANFQFNNPNPLKWTRSVKMYVEYSRTNNSSNTNYTPTYSYKLTSFTATTPSIAERDFSFAWRFVENTDRFGVKQRALKGNADSDLVLWNHQSSFAGNSASYSFWIRPDTLPTSGTRKRIFKRAGVVSHLMTAELDSSGNIHCSDGTTSVSIPAAIQPNQWQMLTFTGQRLGSLTVFVDGAEVGNTNAFGSYYFGKNLAEPIYMRIGGWDGGLSSLGFYDGALTSAQVRQIYDEQKMIFIDHVVFQGVVTPELTPQTATLVATGGTTSASLTLASNVTWSAVSSAGWLQITSGASGSGSTTLSVFAAANPTVTTRTATITIAGREFTVSQAGMPAEIAYTPEIFTTDGGSMMIDVIAGGNAQWTATSGVNWLTVALGESGEGDGSVFLIADPYNNTSQSRTGSVTVAGKTIYFTQRGYALSISPQVAQIGSNSGAGEFGVAAPLSAVWEAIVTQPWITVLGSTTGIGNGTLRYTVAANQTGATRSGKIIVSGQEYSITQTTSLLLATEDDGNGTVTGAGGYDLNSSATLTATTAQGYVFSHWTGDAVGSANPLTVSMDSSKTVKAHFIPAGAANTIATNSAEALGLVPESRLTEERQNTLNEVAANPNLFNLYNRDQMHRLALGSPVLEKNASTGKMTLSLGMKRSTDLTNWADMPVGSSDVSVTNGKMSIQVTPQGNAAFYILEGNE